MTLTLAPRMTVDESAALTDHRAAPSSTRTFPPSARLDRALTVLRVGQAQAYGLHDGGQQRVRVILGRIRDRALDAQRVADHRVCLPLACDGDHLDRRELRDRAALDRKKAT